jgi:hypothetical protein
MLKKHMNALDDLDIVYNQPRIRANNPNSASYAGLVGQNNALEKPIVIIQLG